MAPKKQTKQKPTAYEFPQQFFNQSENLKKLFFTPQPQSIISGQIVTVEHFFSDDLCNQLIGSFESSLKLETTPLIKSKDYAARYNDRISLTDNQAADALWNYLKKILLQKVDYEDEELEDIHETFADAKSLNPQLRIYRYTKGHHFGKHYDDSVKCPLAHEPSKMGTTRWTLLIYLTGGDEFVGGGTIFYPDSNSKKEINVHPSKGLALLHKHGDDCLQHEAEIVKDGVKWVLRSDVTF